MTSELRPAVEVWRDAYDAFTDFYHHTTEKDPARVIEADREAVRAEQAAYLAKARKEAGQNHDLHMAAVNEVVDLKAELAKFKALAETLAGALELADCALSGANMNMRVVYRKVAEALRQYKEARDAS